MKPKAELPKIELEQNTLKHLNTARKWSMFLSIMGFIVNGLIIILAIMAAVFLKIFQTEQTNSRIPETLYVVALFLLAILFFFPLINLFRFSRLTFRAVQSRNPGDFHKAFKNLKSFFVFIGILIIILLILYVAVLIAVGSAMTIPNGLF
jgi:flagellar basal body-associated protein FliL